MDHYHPFTTLRAEVIVSCYRRLLSGQAVQLLNSDTATRSLLGNPVATLEGLALMKDRVRPSWVSEAQLLPLSAAGCPCVLYPHGGQGCGVWSLCILTEFHQENVNSPQSLKSM